MLHSDYRQSSFHLAWHTKLAQLPIASDIQFPTHDKLRQKTVNRCGMNAHEIRAAIALVHLATSGRSQCIVRRIWQLLQPELAPREFLNAVRSVVSVVLLAVNIIICCSRLATAQVQQIAGQAASDQAASKAPSDQPIANLAPASEPDGETLAQQLVDRCRDWLLPPGPSLKSLSYKFHLGNDERQLEIVAGMSGGPRAIWQGATLWTGFHSLVFEPDRFKVAAKRCPANAIHAEPFIELLVRPKNKNQPMHIAVGNGIDGSWRGYFSHRSSEMKLELDEKTHLPMREIHEHAQYQYNRWREIAPGKFAPMLVVVENGASTYRMHFEWLEDAVWILSKAELVREDGTATTVASVSDVKVNDEGLIARQQAQRQERREARAALRQILDKNSAWLAPTLPFKKLSYSFKIEREDILENCALRRDGFAAFEVANVGTGKMAEQLCERLIVTPSGEIATAKRDATWASVNSSQSDEPGPNRADQMRRYATIGCQFDLPLFELARILDAAKVQFADGHWNGTPCTVATVSVPPSQTYLGCGVMLGFTSWSYIHHWYPAQEIIYFDKERMVPLHETFVVAGGTRNVEINFLDYRSLEQSGGKSTVPMRIELVANDFFTCHYKFQIVGGRHWMLESADSWFKPEEKSRGKIENVRFDQSSPLAEAADRQLQAYRQLFEPADALPAVEDEQTEKKTTAAAPDLNAKATHPVDTLPFQLGKLVHIGTATALFDLDQNEQLIARCTKPASDKRVPGTDGVAILLLDESNRLVSAGQANFAADGDLLTATMSFHDSVALRHVVRVAVQGPGDISKLDGAELRKLRVRAASPQADAIPPPSIGDTSGKTQLVAASLKNNAQGQAIAAVHFASRDSMSEFALDASIAAFDNSGKLLFAGSKSGLVHVESEIVDQTWEIPLPDELKPPQVAAIAVGLSRGQTVSMPVGSLWAGLGGIPTFAVEQLLAAETDGCWQAALKQLDRQLNETLDNGLCGSDSRWRDQVSSHRGAADTLRPHADRLLEIVDRTRDPKLLAGIIQLLGFSADEGAAVPAARLLSHDDPNVQDSAAIALGMLKRDAGLTQLDAVLSRPNPALDTWHQRSLLQRRALIALANIRTKASTAILQKQMHAFMDGIETPKPGENRSLGGTYYLFDQLAHLLGRVHHESYPEILTGAITQLEGRQDLKGLVNISSLLTALLKYGDAARPFIEARLRAGDATAIYAVSECRDQYFVRVFRELLDSDLEPNAWAPVTRYLWNAGTPEALEVLRQMFDRPVPPGEENITVRLRAAEALAFFGDNRGFPLALDELQKLAANETPAADQRAKRQRERREETALSVFSRAGNAELANFVVEQSKSASPAVQKALLKIIDKQRSLNPKLIDLLKQWTADPSSEMATAAARILSKHS